MKWATIKEDNTRPIGFTLISNIDNRMLVLKRHIVYRNIYRQYKYDLVLLWFAFTSAQLPTKTVTSIELFMKKVLESF